MKKMIYLSIVFSFLSYFINNIEVAAGKKAYVEVIDLSLQDGRLDPLKYCNSERCTPTIRPLIASLVNVEADAMELYNAMLGAGTNDHAIIRILTLRGALQRIELNKAYRKLISSKSKGKLLKLEYALDDEIGGAYRIAIVAVLKPLPIFYAEELEMSLVPSKSDPETLVEILCSVSNFGIKAIAQFYKERLKKSLEEDIAKATVSSFQKILISLVQGKRAEGGSVDNQKAAADAKTLNSPAGKPWKDKPLFNEILGTRSYPYVRQVFIEYKKVSGREIEVDIPKEFPGPEKQGLLAMVKCIKAKAKFFAERLEETLRMKGGRGMDRRLIRILVSRSEIDLQDIKIEYEKIYKKSLESVVADKIGGEYRRTLTNMVKGNTAPSPAAAPPPAKPAPPPPGK